jgi:hypothetical protein
MEIVYTLEGKEDIDYWKKTGKTDSLKKIRKSDHNNHLVLNYSMYNGL